MDDNGRNELARRLHRVFLSVAGTPGTRVDDATLLGFADNILAGDFTDPRWGPGPGDGGEAMVLKPAVKPLRN